MKSLNTNQPFSSPLTNSNTLLTSKIAQIPSNQISSLKMKPIFRRRITFQYLLPSNITYMTKYRHKMLSRIDLVNLESNKPNFKSIRAICQSLKGAKRISSFNMRHDGSDSQNLKQLKHILNNIPRHLKKLVVFFINLHEEEHPLDNEAAEVLTRLRRYRDLSHLDTFFGCREDVKNQILPRLLQQMKGLKNLKVLNLDLKECKNREVRTEDYEPNAPVFTFRFPRSLRYLRLSFQKSSLPDHKLLDLFASNISRCKYLKYLYLKCLKISSTQKSSISASLFKKKQSIRALRMQKKFSRLEQIQESQIFLQDLKYLKHLTALDLFVSFKHPEDSSKIFTNNLFKRLASLRNLRCLQLELHVQEYSSDPDYQNFLIYLQSLTFLQKLALILHGSSDRRATHLQSLPEVFQSLSSLIYLKLSLSDYTISHTDIISLSHIFHNLNGLQTLALILNAVDLAYYLLEALYKRMAHLNLSSFVLNISHKKQDPSQENKISLLKDEKGLASLFSTLYDFTSLSTLNLNHSTFEIPTKDLKNLSLALRGMKQLTSFSLRLSGFDPDRKFQGLRSLMSSVREVPKLISLHLIFEGDRLCDEEIELLASNFGEERKYLQTLELNFPDAILLGNKSLQVLRNGLGNLSLLKNLKTLFGRKNDFNQEAVLEFLEVLSFLKNLEIIEVGFSPESIPLSFDGLLEKMGGHLNLKTFTVNQKSCLRNQNPNEH